jgi:hypothetical protein
MASRKTTKKLRQGKKMADVKPLNKPSISEFNLQKQTDVSS